MNEQQAVEIASNLVGETSLFSNICASYVGGGRLECNRAEVIELCRLNGITDESEVAAILQEQGLQEPYWQVAFYPVSASGSASSARVATVRVDPKTGIGTLD